MHAQRTPCGDGLFEAASAADGADGGGGPWLCLCMWPAAGACVGAGVDLVTAADLRYCTEDAGFCVKEVDVAITADLGTLQRLPAIVGHGALLG
jgi:Enoyl-CoA hydratase/isomerase